MRYMMFIKSFYTKNAAREVSLCTAHSTARRTLCYSLPVGSFMLLLIKKRLIALLVVCCVLDWAANYVLRSTASVKLISSYCHATEDDPRLYIELGLAH
jgi:hypothetical protein